MPSIISATTTNGLSTSADNSGSLQLATNSGTTAVTIDTSQNVGVGTSSPAYKLDVQGGSTRIYNATFPSLRVQNSATGTTSTDGLLVEMSGSDALFVNYESANMIFSTANTERMRIASDGKVAVGGTGNFGQLSAIQSGAGGYCIGTSAANNGGTFYHMQFTEAGTQRGSITSNGGTTSYITGSDYRLKDNIAPMTGALAKVQQLKPSTWVWKSNDTNGQGFIAHELAEIVPDCVVGEKDAVDAEGNPQYQGIDTSFLVATLTAAIQELNAKVDAQAAEIQALKGVA